MIKSPVKQYFYLENLSQSYVVITEQCNPTIKNLYHRAKSLTVAALEKTPCRTLLLILNMIMTSSNAIL